MKSRVIFKSFWLVCLLFFGSVLNAQINDATIKADINNNRSGVTNIEFVGNGSVDKVMENGSWVSYYNRNFRTNETTEYPGVTYSYFGGAQYVFSGGAYHFDKLTVGDGYYIGFDKPDNQELLELINDNIRTVVAYRYVSIVGELEDIQIDPNSFKWYTTQRVEFIINVTYSYKTSAYKVETAKYSYTINAYSNDKKAVNKDAKWDRMGSSENKDEKQLIDTKTYTSEEMDAMVTFESIAGEKIAKKEYAKLPKIDAIPTFNKDTELFYYVHNLVLTKNENELRAYLYNLLQSSAHPNKSSCPAYLTEYYQSMIDKFISYQEVYQAAYCEYPPIKHQQSASISFYDKEQRAYVRYNAVNEDGTWKLSVINGGGGDKEYMDRMNAIPSDICDANKPAELKKYTIEGAGFSIILPKEPTITEPTDDNAQYIISCTQGESEYLITAEILTQDYIDALKKAKTYQGSAIAWTESFRGQLGATSGKQYAWELNNTKGYQTEWRTSSGTYRVKSVILDDMYYKIIISNSTKSDEENTVFDSFESEKKN